MYVKSSQRTTHEIIRAVHACSLSTRCHMYFVKTICFWYQRHKILQNICDIHTGIGCWAWHMRDMCTFDVWSKIWLWYNTLSATRCCHWACYIDIYTSIFNCIGYLVKIINSVWSIENGCLLKRNIESSIEVCMYCQPYYSVALFEMEYIKLFT